VTEDGLVCCRECGTIVPEQTFVTSYSRKLDPLPMSLYSRHTRFRRYLRSLLINPAQVNLLRDGFSILENAWNQLGKGAFDRTYFISQSVVLFFMRHIFLNETSPKPLRSDSRSLKQLRIAQTLMKHSAIALRRRLGSELFSLENLPHFSTELCEVTPELQNASGPETESP